MTLYWYMHWFWITILINIQVVVDSSDLYKEISLNTTISDMENFSSNLKEITPVTQVLSSTYPAKKFSSTNKSHEFLKEESVIEPNIIVSAENITFSNLTESKLFNNSTSEISNNLYNDTIPELSERLGTEENEPFSVSTGNLSAAGITGISLACVFAVGMLSSVIFLLYRNRGFNRPQVLSDRVSNLDSSGYIDDASVRDNSEEMYSLDNDSFLNSLEAMTIQNYWTDTVKHTKL